MHQVEADNIFNENLYQIAGKVVVIIPTSWTQLSIDEQTLLRKILSSVGRSIDGATILSSPIAIERVAQTHSPAAILCFDATLSNNTELYHIAEINDVPVVFSDPLDTLTDEMKRSLWAALKLLFRN